MRPEKTGTAVEVAVGEGVLLGVAVIVGVDVAVAVAVRVGVGVRVRVAVAVTRAGADALTLINTLKGMAIDITRRCPLLGGITGGLSGPVIKSVALYMVYEVASAVEIPVIGCGGITTATDALEFIMAGASAVQVGTAGFTNPRVPLEVLEGIAEFMEKEGVADIAEVIGAAWRLPPSSDFTV